MEPETEYPAEVQDTIPKRKGGRSSPPHLTKIQAIPEKDKHWWCSDCERSDGLRPHEVKPESCPGCGSTRLFLISEKEEERKTAERYSIEAVWGVATTDDEAIFITSERDWKRVKNSLETGERFRLQETSINPETDWVWLTDGKPISRIDAWDLMFDQGNKQSNKVVNKQKNSWNPAAARVSSSDQNVFNKQINKRKVLL